MAREPPIIVRYAGLPGAEARAEYRRELGEAAGDCAYHWELRLALHRRLGWDRSSDIPTSVLVQILKKATSAQWMIMNVPGVINLNDTAARDRCGNLYDYITQIEEFVTELDVIPAVANPVRSRERAR